MLQEEHSAGRLCLFLKTPNNFSFPSNVRDVNSVFSLKLGACTSSSLSLRFSFVTLADGLPVHLWLLYGESKAALSLQGCEGKANELVQNLNTRGCVSTLGTKSELSYEQHTNVL